MRYYLYPFCFVQSYNNCPFSFVLSFVFENVRRTAIGAVIFNKFYKICQMSAWILVYFVVYGAHAYTHAKFVSEIYSRVTHQTMMIILKLARYSVIFLLGCCSPTDCRSNSIWLVHLQADTRCCWPESYVIYNTLFFDDTRFNKFVKHLLLWTVHLLLLKYVSRISLQRNKRRTNSVILEIGQKNRENWIVSMNMFQVYE